MQAPRCWWIDHGSYGQITQREDEALSASRGGKVVVEYDVQNGRVKVDRILDMLVQEIDDPRNAGPDLSQFREGLRVAHVIVRQETSEPEPPTKASVIEVHALKKPGMLVFLDGEDPIDGGPHVIPDFPVTAAGLDELMDDPDYAKDVMAAALAAGFKVGDFVWTVWFYHGGHLDDPGSPSYWEFIGINEEMSKMFAPSLGADQPEGG